MSDPLSTVLSHLTNLVSFRSSLRLLMIAGSIIGCWVLVEPRLNQFKIPNELAITLITIIGFSLGALLSSILFGIVDLIIRLTKEKLDTRQKNLALDKKEEENKINNLKKIQLLKTSFNDYSHFAKNILLKLKDNDCTIQLERSTDAEHNKAFLGLLEGEIILPLHRLDKTTTLCTINPIYKNAISDLFEEKHRKEVENLLDLNPDGLKMLLKKLHNKSYKEDYIFNIVYVIYQNRYNYTPVIKHELFEEGDYIDNCNIHFYISEHHYPYLSKILGVNIRDYILGNFNEERALARLGKRHQV